MEQLRCQPRRAGRALLTFDDLLGRGQERLESILGSGLGVEETKANESNEKVQQANGYDKIHWPLRPWTDPSEVIGMTSNSSVAPPSLPTTTVTLKDLLGLCLDLGAQDVPGWSAAERTLAEGACRPARALHANVLRQISEGADPLGEIFCRLFTPERRRPLGATYTPPQIVNAMVGWAAAQMEPRRVVDPGLGSGRFLLAAGRRFDKALLHGIELDPIAALLARANLAAAGYSERSRVELGDFRDSRLPDCSGPTLFIGNPPYVRHHLIEPSWKQWLTSSAAKLGLAASQLAGMHVYFLLKTALSGKKGDFGTFVTAAEWLDVNYGKLVRDLFLRQLGGDRIIVIEPAAIPFPDAMTTGAVSCFRMGSKPKSITLQRVDKARNLGQLSGGVAIRRERLESEGRWSHLTRRGNRAPAGFVELGEICRVHRGQVTGANRAWIAGPHSLGVPNRFLFSAVTRARELFQAGAMLVDVSHLKCIVDLPQDLDELTAEERELIRPFLRAARRLGAHQSYIAQQRKAWWSVRLAPPAPILATYMARRPPAFVLNKGKARHINIAHGLYPREPLHEKTLLKLAAYLSRNTSQAEGRTYAGGLTKFEPREMERLLVPGPDILSRTA